EELKLFYAIDRDLYRILVTDLRRSPAESMHVMALWLWLERVGLCNIVGKILSLAPPLINRLADEATICLDIISSNQFRIPASTPEIPLTRSALLNPPPEPFSVEYLRKNRSGVHDAVRNLVSDVCIPALSDVAGVGGADPSARSSSSSSGRASRTMFATFSKGYPVSEGEVREFFGRRFGDDCIESLRMQEVRRESREQALYARVVFVRSSIIGTILKGGDKAKFSINGKHVWMRQFVPR
ncbi:hypothetical protein M569_00820, partial [Genlisea aurea]